MGSLKQDAIRRGLAPCSICGQLADDPGPGSEPICSPCVWAEHDAGEADEARRAASEQEEHDRAADEHYGMRDTDFYNPGPDNDVPF